MPKHHRFPLDEYVLVRPKGTPGQVKGIDLTGSEPRYLVQSVLETDRDEVSGWLPEHRLSRWGYPGDGEDRYESFLAELAQNGRED